jgi:hypothetical protein
MGVATGLIKSGLYALVFAECEDCDDDPTYLGAAYVGEVPRQFRQSYLKALLKRFNKRYSREQRPLYIDFCYLGSPDEPQNEFTLTEEALMDLVLDGNVMQLDQREVLDYAVAVANEMRQVLTGFNDQIDKNTGNCSKKRPKSA